jgi:hypothetical protein
MNAPAPSPPPGSLAGRLLYRLYHAPRTHLETWRDARLAPRWDAAMRRAAAHLPPAHLPDWGLALPPIRFLTGARFAHQTAFCARSLTLACGTRLRLEFFDDGSLTPEQNARLLALFPDARIHSAADSQARLARFLPAARYPVLHELRSRSPLMRKLLDLRAGFTGPSLYLDSDMLFFKKPDLLLDWLRNPAGEYHMHEPGDSGAYVDSREILAQQLGLTPPAGVNTGILALDDSAFDWPALEALARRFTPAQRRHIWAEQTLTACHLAARPSRPLPAADYRVCTSRRDLAGAPPILRHYVYKAKMPYLQREWRVNLRQACPFPPA